MRPIVSNELSYKKLSERELNLWYYDETQPLPERQELRDAFMRKTYAEKLEFYRKETAV